MQDKIIFVDDINSQIILELSQKFQYKKILILGYITKEIEDFFREYRYGYYIDCMQEIDKQLINNYDAVVLYNIYDSDIIDTCSQYEIPFIVVTNKYLSYENIDNILLNNLLLKIIVDKFALNELKSQCYCENLIDTLYQYVADFDMKLQKLFYETNYQYERLNISTFNCLNINDFTIENMYFFCQNTGGFLQYILEKTKKTSNYAYKLLLIQVLINIYQNFIEFVNPNNVDIVENYSFDNSKFWFILSCLKSTLLDEFQKLKSVIENVKKELITSNVDYYYNLCSNYYDFDIKTDLMEFSKEYKGNGLIKIIYQMGLVKFNV